MDSLNEQKSKMSDAASDLLHEGKKWAQEKKDEGMHLMSDMEESMKECSDKLVKKVQENPLASVLIAGSIGFLLSKILK